MTLTPAFPPALRTFVVLALTFVVVSSLGACAKESPEAKVRAVLALGEERLEARDLSVLDLVDEAYRDDQGRTREQMKLIALAVTRRGPLSIVMRDTQVTVTGDTARATTTAYALQGQGEGAALTDVIPQNAKAFALEIELALRDDEWKVTAVNGAGGARAFGE